MLPHGKGPNIVPSKVFEKYVIVSFKKKSKPPCDLEQEPKSAM